MNLFVFLGLIVFSPHVKSGSYSDYSFGEESREEYSVGEFEETNSTLEEKKDSKQLLSEDDLIDSAKRDFYLFGDEDENGSRILEELEEFKSEEGEISSWNAAFVESTPISTIKSDISGVSKGQPEEMELKNYRDFKDINHELDFSSPLKMREKYPWISYSDGGISLQNFDYVDRSNKPNNQKLYPLKEMANTGNLEIWGSHSPKAIFKGVVPKQGYNQNYYYGYNPHLNILPRKYSSFNKYRAMEKANACRKYLEFLKHAFTDLDSTDEMSKEEINYYFPEDYNVINWKVIAKPPEVYSAHSLPGYGKPGQMPEKNFRLETTETTITDEPAQFKFNITIEATESENAALTTKPLVHEENNFRSRVPSTVPTTLDVATTTTPATISTSSRVYLKTDFYTEPFTYNTFPPVNTTTTSTTSTTIKTPFTTTTATTNKPLSDTYMRTPAIDPSLGPYPKWDDLAIYKKRNDCNDYTLPCPDTFNITYPLNGYCDKYVSCESGRAIRRTCSEGLQFNLITRSCDLPHNSICAYACPEATGHYGIPGDCEGYFVCKNSILEYRMCPPRMHWDINKGTCTFFTMSTCPMKCSRTHEVKAYAGDCRAYIICLNGVPYYHRCPPLMKFDSVRLTCIPENISTCKDDPKLLTKRQNPIQLCRDIENKLGSKFWCNYFGRS